MSYESSDDILLSVSTIIQKKSLADEVAERLRKQITSGKYKTGDKLPTEPQLMKKYGVGRSSIREAIKMLSNLGFLNVQQGVGTFVISQTANEPISQRLKRADMHEIDEVRRILEIKIAEKAALTRNEEDIAKIRKYLSERARTAGEGLLEECIEADVNFHISIAEATHNEILADLYRSVAMHIGKGFKHIYSDTGSFVKTQKLHEQLGKYIIAQDAPKALNMVLNILNHD